MEESNSILGQIRREPQPEVTSQMQTVAKPQVKPKFSLSFFKKNGKVIALVLLSLLTCLLFVMLGYYLGKNSILDKVIPQSVQSALFKRNIGMDNQYPDMIGRENESEKPPTICDNEDKKILSVVEKFEEFQKDRKASDILDLFTDANTEEEKEAYNTLSSNDGGLYKGESTNYKTEEYRVTSGPLEMGGKCIVNVEEKRSYYDDKEESKYKQAQARNFMVELQKVDNKEWMISQFQSSEANIKKTKYSGFLMEIIK